MVGGYTPAVIRPIPRRLFYDGTQYSAKNRVPPRSPLVGTRIRRPRALLSLPPPLPHRRRTKRFLFHPRESRRKTLQPGICLARRPPNRSHREKTAQSFSAR